MTRIDVVAAILVDERGRTLMVRKRGTEVFMQPGGKPEPGEEPRAALVRELDEELGLRVAPELLEFLGSHESPAANEPGHRVRSQSYWCHQPVGPVRVGAEIAEARWIDPADPGVPVAPLSTEHFFAIVSAATRGAGADL